MTAARLISHLRYSCILFLGVPQAHEVFNSTSAPALGLVQVIKIVVKIVALVAL